MTERLLNILKNTKDISGWLVKDETVEACELFFIRKALDMNRCKNVRHMNVTVYRDFEEDGVQYKGSASADLSPSMTDVELERKIADAAQAAAFVKNPAYELAQPTDEKLKEIKNAFVGDDLFAYLPKLVDAVYAADHLEQARINSCEFFLRRVDTRIISSLGVDESYTSYRGQVELVVEAKTDGEEVELFDIINFSDFDPDKLRQDIAESLEHVSQRAAAAPLPAIKDVPVILRRENVGKLFGYYVDQTNVSLVYQKYSSAKAGESIQGSVTGDPLTLSLLPELKNSIASRYIDADGVKLCETQVIKDGVVQTLHGSNRYSQYLGIAPTGNIGNVRVEGGSQTLSELKSEPHLEIFYFSDFQMDEITGDFGGEIRLGIYFDGEKEIPVCGGSVNGNIKDVQAGLHLSREMQTMGNYCCPQAVKLYGVSISS